MVEGCGKTVLTIDFSRENPLCRQLVLKSLMLYFIYPQPSLDTRTVPDDIAKITLAAEGQEASSCQ